MPAEVITVQLGDVAEVFNGKTPSKQEQRTRGHPVLKIKDVNEYGEFDGAFASFVDPELAKTLSKKFVRGGDTLILNAAHNSAYVGSKSFFARGSAVGALATGEWLMIRPQRDRADPRLVFYWSRVGATRKRIGELVRGIHLYPKDVAELPLRLPPPAHQERIANALDRASQLRRTHRVALEMSEGLLGAVFLEMFPEYSEFKQFAERAVPLGDLVEPGRGITYGIVQAGPHIPDGVPYIRTGDIVQGEIKDFGLLRTSVEIAEIW
jgi:type I restriction enzyme S subunit